MMSYNTYPILLSAPLEAPEGPYLVEKLEAGYHLNVVQAKRRGLIAKGKMFRKKYKKYNKILNRLSG